MAWHEAHPSLLEDSGYRAALQATIPVGLAPPPPPPPPGAGAGASGAPQYAPHAGGYQGSAPPQQQQQYNFV